MRSFYILVMVTNLILYISCSSAKMLSALKLDEAIVEFLGGSFESANNSANDKVLAWRLEPDSDTALLRYAVWDLKTGERIYSGSALQGKVKWLSENTLEVHDYPGIIDDQNPLYRYKIDLKTKTKTAIREENKI